MGGDGTKKCCTECIQRCSSIHGKRDPSSIACSFFKVLIDDRFSEVLFIPPKFAHNACSTLGKTTHLEDSTGQCWRVRLSTVNGSLAFQRGWDQFASDHFLRLGQFLVFRYVIESHFMVQIYDESGCEKLNFSQKMNCGGGRKKADPKLYSTHLPSDCRNSVSIEEPSMTIYRDSKQDPNSTFPFAYNNRTIDSAVKDAQKTEMTSKNVSLRDSIQERPKFQPAADSTEIPYYMIDRNNKTEQGETRTSLFDLSNCELFRVQSGAGQIEEVSVAIKEEDSHHYDRFPKGPQASVGEGTLCEDLVAVEQALGRASFDVSDLAMTKININAKNVHKVPLNIKEQSCCHHSSLQPQIPSLKLAEREKEKKPDRYDTVFALHARQNFIDAGDKSALKPKKEETSLVGSRGSVLKIMTKMSGLSDAPVVLEGQKGVANSLSFIGQKVEKGKENSSSS